MPDGVGAQLLRAREQLDAAHPGHALVADDHGRVDAVPAALERRRAPDGVVQA
jgi:hypothetical protein